MSKTLLFLVISWIPLFTLAQNYDSVHIEKKDVDENNWIFAQGRAFAYEIDIEKDGEALYLAENGSRTFELTTQKDSAKIKDVFLKVINPKKSKRSNKNQTEILYFYEIPPRIVSNTGVVENDQNVWIHPPRSGFFRSLETCPFPYYHFDHTIGDEWSDAMKISASWSDPYWGEWEKKLRLDYTYKLDEDEVLETPIGTLTCKVISSKAESRIGTTKLKSYFSGEYGFVRLEYELLDGTKVTLKMIGEKKGKIIKDASELIAE